MLMSISVPAFATEPENAEGSDIVLGEENATVKEDAIIIDGVMVTKAEFIAALPNITKMQNSPKLMLLYDYSQIISNNAKEAGALAAVGVGISAIFAEITYTLGLVNITASTDYPAFMIPAGTFDGVDRHLNIIFMDDTVIVDGIVMGLNWLTFELVKYVSEHIDDIGEFVDWVVVIGEIASEYEYGQCEQAAEAIKEELLKNDLHGSIVTLTWAPIDLPYACVWSDIRNMKAADNPLHVGVYYEGKIYCNIHPYGLPRNSWIEDFHYPTDSTKTVVEVPF